VAIDMHRPVQRNFIEVHQKRIQQKEKKSYEQQKCNNVRPHTLQV
jgi:hypothetical protein